jgi:hypothetical protein
VANALAYYDTATITAVKSFIVQAPGVNLINIFGVNLLTLFESYIFPQHRKITVTLM